MLLSSVQVRTERNNLILEISQSLIRLRNIIGYESIIFITLYGRNWRIRKDYD